MGFASALCRARSGLEAPLVRVEVHVEGGLHSFHIVGLPETAVRESRERVRGALKNCNHAFPKGKITVNLAPAELPKSGGRFDLAIALAILAATNQLDPRPLLHMETIGELSLAGEIRAVPGTLSAVQAAQRAGRSAIVPTANATEAGLVANAEVFTASHIDAAVAHLRGRQKIAPLQPSAVAPGQTRAAGLAQIRGHAGPKRALVLAAAGRHNLLMSGPPGTGKTLLARCLPHLLPPLRTEEALEVAAIASLGGGLRDNAEITRPFRAPHHSASAVALAGGGSDPLPGEISLAHQGVLFLDEIPEFSRSVLETLREPMESGRIAIARARARVEYPARFQLIAAMNPCPAGYDCKGASECVCAPDAARRYRGRLSGPLLDRIDLHVSVPQVPVSVLTAAIRGAPVDDTQDSRAREQIAVAQDRALQRQGVANAHLDGPGTELHCAPDSAGLALLERAAERLQLSARSWHRCLRTARTIADLVPRERINREDVAEALAYRAQQETDAVHA